MGIGTVALRWGQSVKLGVCGLMSSFFSLDGREFDPVE